MLAAYRMSSRSMLRLFMLRLFLIRLSKFFMINRIGYPWPWVSTQQPLARMESVSLLPRLCLALSLRVLWNRRGFLALVKLLILRTACWGHMCVHQKHHEVLPLLHGQHYEYLWAQGLSLPKSPKDNPLVFDTCSVSCSPAAADGLKVLCSACYCMC